MTVNQLSDYLKSLIQLGHGHNEVAVKLYARDPEGDEPLFHYCNVIPTDLTSIEPVDDNKVSILTIDCY